MITLNFKVNKILSAQNKNQITRSGRAFTKPAYQAYASTLQTQLEGTAISSHDMAHIKACEALEVEVEFFFRLPKGTSLRRREALHLSPCLKKTDLDNCNKFVQDEVFKFLEVDDSKVCDLLLKKKWINGEHDEIKIIIRELEG